MVKTYVTGGSAYKVGVTPGHIADLETGRRDPGGKLAFQIAIVLGFPMEHFYLPSYLQNASKKKLDNHLRWGFLQRKILEHYPHYVDKTVGTEKHEEKEIRFVYWGRNLREPEN